MQKIEEAGGSLVVVAGALRAKLELIGTPCGFQTGEMLCQERRSVEECLLVRSGRAELVTGGRATGSFSGGLLIGVPEALTRRASTVAIRARSDIEAVAISTRALRESIVSDPTLAADLLASLSRQLDSVLHVLTGLSAPRVHVGPIPPDAGKRLVGVRTLQQKEAPVAAKVASRTSCKRGEDMKLKTRDDKQDRLSTVGLFAQAGPKALRNLAEAVEDTSVDAGHVLIKQDIHHAQSFVIESGTATVEVNGTVVTELGPGEIVGELAYLAYQPASATVTAKTDMRLMLIPHNRLETILDNDTAFVRSVVTVLAKRLIATDALIT